MNRFIATLLSVATLAGCGQDPSMPHDDHHGAEPGATEFERGPHRGRMLRDGDFALEVSIVESHDPPQFRLFAYKAGEPLPPADVVPAIEVTRLDGEVDTFAFKPEKDYLASNGAVTEPHSFDVAVNARHAGNTYQWSYESHEGRTTIAADAAEDAGVRTAIVGPAIIRETVQLMGRIAIDGTRHAAVKARFPGIVRSVHVQQGEQVRRGQALVTIEGNDSLRSYPVVAPFDGIVLTRNTNVGDVAGESALIELADLSNVWIELRAIGTDADSLVVGQAVRVRSATSLTSAETTIDALLPLATASQGVIARANLANPEGKWRPGMVVTGEVTLASRNVPLAVSESGLQRFRDSTVVFAQVGDTYEVRMIELGQRDGEYAEVLDGIKPGTRYVTEQSFLIRADIEKSGAGHDH